MEPSFISELSVQLRVWLTIKTGLPTWSRRLYYIWNMFVCRACKNDKISNNSVKSIYSLVSC